MASGQIFNPFLITMLSVCGAATLVFYVRKLRALKGPMNEGSATDGDDRAFRLTGYAGQFETALTGDREIRVTFKDSWENGVWHPRDGQPTFTDRAVS